MFSLSELLKNKTPRISVLDIGAMIEGEPRYHPIFSQDHADLTLVEPNRNEAMLLEEKYGRTARIIENVLGDGNPKSLNITHYPGCSSTFKPDPSIINLFTSISTSSGSNFETIKTKKVETKKLDDISQKITNDYIKIDAQGSELEILENGIRTLKNVVIIETEIEFIPIYKNQPLFGDLQLFLQNQGFILHKFIDVGSRCFKPLSFNDNILAGMSQLLWADAIFVKDFTNLDDYTDVALLKSSYIMHDLYKSYDFVYFLLHEYDKRQGSTFALTYAKTLSTFSELPKALLNLKEQL